MLKNSSINNNNNASPPRSQQPSGSSIVVFNTLFTSFESKNPFSQVTHGLHRVSNWRWDWWNFKPWTSSPPRLPSSVMDYSHHFVQFCQISPTNSWPSTVFFMPYRFVVFSTWITRVLFGGHKVILVITFKDLLNWIFAGMTWRRPPILKNVILQEK